MPGGLEAGTDGVSGKSLRWCIGRAAYLVGGRLLLVMLKPAKDLDGVALLKHAAADDGLSQSATAESEHERDTQIGQRRRQRRDRRQAGCRGRTRRRSIVLAAVSYEKGKCMLVKRLSPVLSSDAVWPWRKISEEGGDEEDKGMGNSKPDGSPQ